MNLKPKCSTPNSLACSEREAMKFILEIELGNDAMRTGNEVGEKLQLISRILGDSRVFGGPLTPIEPQGIRDLNGNTVGKWEVVAQ